MKNNFITLLQASLNIQKPKIEFGETEWKECFIEAQKQSLAGVLFPVAQKYMVNDNGGRIEPLFGEWLGIVVQTDFNNKDLDKKAAMLTRIFQSWGYQSCILKGQGVAQQYPEPSLRQSGDIDIWVNGKQGDIIKQLRDQFIGITNIDYVHSGITIFNNVSVEVHFRPSWMYNPFTNRKLQKYFRDHAEEQFGHMDEMLGFNYPTIQFNLVYSLIHINRHIFEEGIGLRQLCDYYYILKHSTKEERDKALAVLIGLGLRKFVGAIMYIEDVVLGIDKELMLCQPNEKEGRFLLEEIMRGGNFGHYDERNRFYSANDRFRRGLFTLWRNLRYLRHYPSEVLWKPLWQIWHWCWRKWKGYL